MSPELDPAARRAEQAQRAALLKKQTQLKVSGIYEDYQARDRVKAMNDLALINVLAETGITISAKDFPKWRPTKRVTSEIVGVGAGYTIVATDGNLGLFIQNDRDNTIINKCFGHIQHFDGKVQTLHGVPKPHVPTEVKERKKKVAKQKTLTKRDERIAQRVLELMSDLED